jgi:hypothetical protein
MKFILQTKVAISLFEKSANKNDPTPKTIIKKGKKLKENGRSHYLEHKILIML